MVALNGKSFCDAVLPCVEAEFRIVVHHILHHPSTHIMQENFAGMVKMGIYESVSDLVLQDRADNRISDYHFMALELVAKKAKKVLPKTPQKPAESASDKARAALGKQLKKLQRKRTSASGSSSRD
jgi:hypothetical protein